MELVVPFRVAVSKFHWEVPIKIPVLSRTAWRRFWLQCVTVDLIGNLRMISENGSNLQNRSRPSTTFYGKSRRRFPSKHCQPAVRSMFIQPEDLLSSSREAVGADP